MTSPNGQGAGRTVALVYNTDLYLHRLRGSLIRALTAEGYDVYAIAPEGPSVPAIEADGATFVRWPLPRRGLNPVVELLSILRLWGIYRRISPDIAHHFTAKPNIYGAIAGRLAGVSVTISSVNGLGYVFTGDERMLALVRPLVTTLYRMAFRLNSSVVVQNGDDIEELEKRGILSAGAALHAPGGSGVDIDRFTPDAIPPSVVVALRESLGIAMDTPVVLFVGRMLWHKGIQELVECAHIIGPKLGARFVLVGPTDEGNPAAIPSDRLVAWSAEGPITLLGERSDIRELLAMADVVALPSYREGFPRVLIEACAMGKPIVTTDVPGCRDVVTNDLNGLIVAPKDGRALAGAVEALLADSSLRARLSVAARRRAVDEFDEKIVTGNTLSLYDRLIGGGAVLPHGAS